MTEMQQQDLHRCAWWPGCSNPDLRDKDNPRPALIVDGVICDGCMWRLKKAVRGLVRDWERLSEAIGERGVSARQRVRLTLDPAIPLNVATEALMGRLTEAADRAASVVEDELGMTGIARYRSDTPPDGRTERGYLAAKGKRHTAPSDRFLVGWSARTLLEMLDVLVEAKPTWHQVWMPLPDSKEECDKYPNGQPTQLVEMSGLDLAREIVTVNQRIGTQLGLSHLRTTSKIPCHRCGAETLGRDDGYWDIDCTTCGARYSEGEHNLLIRLQAEAITTEEENHMLKWLLAERDYRLDTLRKRVAAVDEITPEAIAKIMDDGPEQVLALVKMVAGQCAEVLTIGDPAWPHPLPEDRQIGVREHEKKSTTERLAAAIDRRKATKAVVTKKKPAAAIVHTTVTSSEQPTTHRRRERTKR